MKNYRVDNKVPQTVCSTIVTIVGNGRQYCGVYDRQLIKEWRQLLKIKLDETRDTNYT